LFLAANANIPIVNTLFSYEVRNINAKRNSFHTSIKVKIIPVMSPGFMIGRAIVNMVLISEAPSIVAASKIELGTVFKKPKSNHVQNGRKKAASVIMSARWVSMIFVRKTILNKAMIIIAGAINWVTRIKKRIVDLNLRRYLTRIKAAGNEHIRHNEVAPIPTKKEFPKNLPSGICLKISM
jgi:hypothetical protein